MDFDTSDIHEYGLIQQPLYEHRRNIPNTEKILDMRDYVKRRSDAIIADIQSGDEAKHFKALPGFEDIEHQFHLASVDIKALGDAILSADMKCMNPHPDIPSAVEHYVETNQAHLNMLVSLTAEMNRVHQEMLKQISLYVQCFKGFSFSLDLSQYSPSLQAVLNIHAVVIRESPEFRQYLAKFKTVEEWQNELKLFIELTFQRAVESDPGAISLVFDKIKTREFDFHFIQDESDRISPIMMCDAEGWGPTKWFLKVWVGLDELLALNPIDRLRHKTPASINLADKVQNYGNLLSKRFKSFTGWRNEW